MSKDQTHNIHTWMNEGWDEAQTCKEDLDDVRFYSPVDLDLMVSVWAKNASLASNGAFTAGQCAEGIRS